MSAKKTRKRAYIPPSNEVVNRREPSSSARPQQRASRTTAAPRGASARQQYEYPQPSLRRTLRRLPIYFVLIFVLQYFFAGKGSDISTSQRLVVAAGSSAFVTIIFAPFMHVMDKFAYNRYLKRAGKLPAAAPKQ